MRAPNIILLIASVVGWALVFIIARHAGKLKNDNINYASVIAEQADSIRYHKSITGREIASKLAAQVTVRQLSEVYQYHLADIRKEMEIKDKNIRALIKVTSEARGSGTTIIRDTVFRDAGGNEITEHSFTLSDGYLSLAGRFRAKSDLFYEYSYKDSLTVVSHFKNETGIKGLFKSPKLFVDASFRNPNNKITGLTNIQVSDFKDKRFGVGPYIGWDVINWRVAAGVSIHYSLIRF